MYKTFRNSRIMIFLFSVVFIMHFFSSASVLPAQAAGQARIHYLTLPGSTVAVLLECNGHYGMVDSGEDSDYPDGSDPRYPVRPGITQGVGYEDDVIEYLHSVGVTQDNFEFYIGTHPHSDHIGSADEVIRAFHPKRVYIQEYKDSYITHTGNLWDNLYVYDHMLEAATEVGATIIQNFSPDSPLYPEKVSIKGSILWNDQDNLAGIRPDEITAHLSNSSGNDLQSLSVSPNEEGNWNYEFSHLQKYDDAKNPLTYFVSIDSIDGYSISSEDGYDFLFLHIPEEMELEKPEELALKDSKEADTSDSSEILNETNEATIPVSEDTDKTNKPEIINESDAQDEPEICNKSETINEAEMTGNVDISTFLKKADIPEGGIFDDNTNDQNVIESSDNLFTDEITFYDQVDAACLLDPNNAASLLDAAPAQTGIFDDLSNTQNTTSTPTFTLGNDMVIQIKHYGTDYKINPKPDANYFSLGVLVQCNGKSAFLSGDINNYEGVETALTADLVHVDILTLGHHGNYGSNTYGYVTGLTPQIMICPGRCGAIPNHSEEYSTLKALLHMGQNGTPLYSTHWYQDYCDALIFSFDENLSNNLPTSVSYILTAKGVDSTDYLYYLDGIPSSYTGWMDYNGHTYYFDNSIYPERNKWLSLENKKYYLTPDGTLKTGWLYFNNKWYYLGSDGIMQTGWLFINDKTYYLDPDSGIMLIGWQQLNDHRYFFNPDNGVMQAGWQFIEHNWYYLDPDNNAMKTGWQFINNKWYYLAPASGAMKTGWQKINNKWYYLTPGSGAMKTGWQKINNKWYYLTPGSGAMKTGWQKINNKWYYLTPGSGAMKTGWQKINNKWYYLTPGSGAMKTGWQKINGKYYYMYPSGAMASNTRINGYYVNKSGIWVP